MSRAPVAAFALLATLAAIRPASASEVAVVLPRSEGAAGEEAIVPIRVEVDTEVSALQGGLSYDPKVFDVIGVVAGPALPEGARADFNADEPGWLRFGFVSSPTKAPFKGTGVALSLRVRVKGAVGAETALTPSKVRAWEPNDTEHHVRLESGALRVVPKKPISWVVFVIIGALLLLLLLFVILRRRSRSRPIEFEPVDDARPEPAAPARTAPRPPSRSTPGSRFCTSCGTPAKAPEARFCGVCGAPLA